MPFDSAPGDAPATTNPVVEMFDAMLALFGPNGEGWMQGAAYNEAETRFCLSGALDQAYKRCGNRLSYHRARALLNGTLQGPTVEWNDTPHRTFSEVREAVIAAREAARIPRFEQQKETV